MADNPVKNFRVDIGFTRAPDDDIINLCFDVVTDMRDNPFFPTPTVPSNQIIAAQSAFSSAMTEARKGGTDRTRAKNAAKLVLTDLMVINALYCQGQARHDLDALLSSGYDVVSTNRVSYPLAQPRILSIANDVSGQLTVRGQSILNGRIYQAQVSQDNGVTWTNMNNFNGARQMVLKPLTPGKVYWVQISALGGSTGQSPWSNPVPCMVT